MRGCFYRRANRSPWGALEHLRVEISVPLPSRSVNAIERGLFLFNQECLVDPFDREASFSYDQCVDDEVRLEIAVDCSLSEDNVSVNVDPTPGELSADPLRQPTESVASVRQSRKAGRRRVECNSAPSWWRWKRPWGELSMHTTCTQR